jgi:hypothetical protein
VSDLRHFRYGVYEQQVTKLLRVNGIFRDRRSKVVHDLAGEMHLLLYGADMSEQRSRVFAKKSGLQYPVRFELDHKQGGMHGRCDCQHNLQVLTREDHEAKHGRTTRFAEVKREAVKDFEAIYGKERRLSDLGGKDESEGTESRDAGTRRAPSVSRV